MRVLTVAGTAALVAATLGVPTLGATTPAARTTGWCRKGPPAAHVADVEVTLVQPTGATSFEVDY